MGGEGLEGAAQGVVFCVVRGVGDRVATKDGGAAVVWVRCFVGCEVDFAEESG